MTPRIAIVGAGFGGVGMAIHLRRAGIEDITVLERGERVGGVWNRNTYPGAACDVPSHLYSFSFARNPGWGRRFAEQPEIQRYVEDTARREGVLDRIRLSTEVESARWDADAAVWRIEAEGGAVEAEVMVAACGQLTRPAIPRLKGLESFAGPAFHSADWRHDVDLTGKRVGVIGTGASAIQFVPAIQPQVASLTVIQRSPPWVLPKLDRAYLPRHRALFERLPAAQLAGRFGWWAAMEAAIAGFVGHDAAMRPAAAAARWHLRRQVPDPVLRDKLTPRYRMGCKRILLTSDWYPALSQPNVEVVTSGVREVTPGGITLADGTTRALDVIIFGTGFQARTFVAPMDICGREETLEEAWAGLPHAWHGISVPGFPNAFLVYGPNTFGGSGSAIYMLESQMRHITAAVERLRRSGARTIEVRGEAHDEFIRELRGRQAKTVWATGGCHSWYVDEHGRDPTNWPGYTAEYRRRVLRDDPAVYAMSE